jgi:hypothetical protein
LYIIVDATSYRKTISDVGVPVCYPFLNKNHMRYFERQDDSLKKHTKDPNKSHHLKILMGFGLRVMEGKEV